MLTRDELKVGETYQNYSGQKRVLLFIGNNRAFYREENTGYENSLHINDILGSWFKIPVRKKGWINIYKHSSYENASTVHPTKKAADEMAACNSLSLKRTACIEVEFEEGQGL